MVSSNYLIAFARTFTRLATFFRNVFNSFHLLVKTEMPKRIFFSVLVLLMTGNHINAQTSQDTTRSDVSSDSGGGNFFTGGNASVSRLETVPEMQCGVSKVSFEPGARTIWHSHAGGQVIVVTSGTAWYQEKGKPKKIVRTGEAVVAAPGVMHWHGASADGPMSHTVSTPNLNKGGVTAGAAVTDEEYKALPGK